MRKSTVFIICLMIGLSLSGCKKVDKEIIGSWYCEDNNILLTFYEDQTMDRDLVDFESENDGTYRWYIDEQNMLKISDLDGETLLTQDYNSDWSLEDSLKLEDNIYVKATNKQVSSEDASSRFYDKCPDLSCVVFFNENVTDDEINELKNQLEQMDSVKSTEYKTADDAWEEFKDLYFEEGSDAYAGFEGNPLENSSNLVVYVETPQDLDEIMAYIEESKIVRKMNSSDSFSVPDDSLL